MKILRVADVADNRTGGMSRVMYCTGDALAEQGHQVDYLFSEGLGSAPDPRLRRFVVPARLPGLIRARHRAVGYDVVELHEPLAAPYALARAVARDLPPLVVMTYGIEARGRQAVLGYRDAKGIPVSLKGRLAPLSVVWQASYGLTHADHVLCFNHEDGGWLQAHGVPEERITVTHSGVTDPFLEAGRAAPSPDRAGILFLGTWIERKGVLDLVPAVTRVLRAHPAQRFTVAGCGASADAVRAQFPDDLQSRLEVLPRIDTDAALIDLYRRHAVFVLPSYFEGQPLSMLEAAALGQAIVTTDVCGMRDFVVHGESGLLLRPGDVDGLTAALDGLVREPAKAARMGEAARRAVQAFTWRRSAERMLAGYAHAAASAVRR